MFWTRSHLPVDAAREPPPGRGPGRTHRTLQESWEMNRATSARLIVATLAVSLLACSRLPTNPNDNTWRFLPGHVEPLSFAAFRHSRPCWVRSEEHTSELQSLAYLVCR